VSSADSEKTTLGPRVRGYVAPLLSDSPAWSALLDAPVAIGVYRLNGQLLLVNHTALELFGFPLATILQHGWIGLAHPEPSEQQKTHESLAELMATEGTTRIRRNVHFGDHQQHLVEITSTRIRLPDGEAAIMSTVVEPVGMTMPEGSGERGYRELVEDGPDILTRFDAASARVTFVSRAIERATGFAPDTFYSDPARYGQMLHPDSLLLWQSAFEQVRKGDARSFELTVRHSEGRESILQQALYPIRGRDGTVRVIEGAARDVTTVRQLEALKATNEARTSLDRLKSQLLANVSHELRTPLVSIKGYNELLLRGALGPLTARQKRGLEIAGANTERLIELIESLLDFARREEERLELHRARFDLRLAIEDGMSALKDRIASRNLTLRLELGSAPLEILGDRTRLAQVFRALIGNAEKFSEPSTAGEILVRADVLEGNLVQIAVSDRGIGIPKEAHARIFDRFYQVDASSTRRFGGAGLGLALAKELVTLHGGEIRVESAEGRGSTFTVRLPLAEATGDRPAESARPVLLVGADERSWAELKPALESPSLGPVDLFSAHSESEVLRRARRHRPDLVLLAFQQPGAPAASALVAQLKREKETASLPVVVVSSDGRRPIGRADLVTDAGDQGRLIAGLKRLLGRVPEARRPPKVVVVEDEVEILDFTRFVLEREGYEVGTFTTGQEALAAIDGDTGLVILDIALEGDDGIQVCRELKGAPATSAVPILIMTAMSGEEVRQISIAAGAEGYLMKPFGVDEFLRQVRLHLRLRADAQPREPA
ncbi:MAG: ATP-binding protein, partial [Polyangia bacterium]